LNISYKNLKLRTHQIVESAAGGDRASRAFDIFIVVLITLSVIAVIIGSVDGVSRRYGEALSLFELVSVIVFTAEYFLRIWSSTANAHYKGKIVGRVKYALSPILIIDLMAILPFYLPLLLPIDLRFLRSLRLIRLFRIFKLARYSKTIKTLGSVLKNKKEDLIITVFAIFLLLIIASSIMYFAEHEAQPEAFSSIPSAMWWGIITLTTVGYGDIYPITIVGKMSGAIIAIIGIGLFALQPGFWGQVS
jgi:voltage-gated potassium channel